MSISKLIYFELSCRNSPATIITILGVISNVLLLVAFIKDPLKCFRNSSTYLVMNLSVCDCLTCLLGPMFLTNVLPTGYWTGWRLIYTHFIFWFGTASIVSIASISIDRFLMIAYPLKHRTLLQGKAMMIWLATIWIVSLFPPAAELFFGTPEDKQEVILYCFFTTVTLLSLGMYASSFHKIKKLGRNIALQSSTESLAQKKRILKEKHFLKTIILISCIAFVCITPSIVVFRFYHSTHCALASIFFGILLINYAVNPLIYFARFPNYRKTFFLLYCSRCCGQ